MNLLFTLFSLLILVRPIENPEENKQNGPSVFRCDYLGQKLSYKKAELFSPHFISTKVEHSAIMFTSDGKEMWFGRMNPGKIWYLTYQDGRWSKIKKAPLDDNYSYLYPFLSPDGNRLYFTSDRPADQYGKDLHRGDGDLWYIERIKNAWDEPVHLGETINFGNRHAIDSVSSIGNIYYTARTGELYHYTTKMYCAEFKDGKYSTPHMISELDSEAPSLSPYVSPDETYIIFSSFRNGLGMSDLFISYKMRNSNWSTPKNLGSNVNSAFKDEFPYVTPDGKFLFFNSNRVSELNKTAIPDGSGNMYWVKAGFIEELKKDTR